MIPDHSNKKKPCGIDDLLSRLEKCRATGAGRWVARCPAHQDKTPSLSIRELPDGRILIHCFTGCSVDAVLSAIGLELSDLFPENSRAIGHANPEHRPFPAADVLKSLNLEALVVSAAARTILDGRTLNDDDQERLMTAFRRIERAVELSGVNRRG